MRRRRLVRQVVPGSGFLFALQTLSEDLQAVDLLLLLGHRFLKARDRLVLKSQLRLDLDQSFGIGHAPDATIPVEPTASPLARTKFRGYRNEALNARRTRTCKARRVLLEPSAEDPRERPDPAELARCISFRICKRLTEFACFYGH